MADNNEEEYLDNLLNTYMNKDSDVNTEESTDTDTSEITSEGNPEAGSNEDNTSKTENVDNNDDNDVSDLMSSLMDIVNNTDSDDDRTDNIEINESDNNTIDDGMEENSDNFFSEEEAEDESEDNAEDVSKDNSITDADTLNDHDSNEIDLSDTDTSDIDEDDSDIFALEENMEENMEEPDNGTDSKSVDTEVEQSSEIGPDNEVIPKSKKAKKKFSLKNLFKSKKEVPEIDAEQTNANNNSEIINELYGNTESLDKIPVEEETKKEKKVKEKKPKKVKEKKPKKEKSVKEKNPADYMTIKTGTIVRTVIFVAVIVTAVIFGSKFTYYKISMHDARNYYNKGQYDLAYDKLAGLDIKSDDENFYNKLRTIMAVYNKYQSYLNYLELGRTSDAIDSLIQGVAKYNECKKNAEAYVVTDKVDAIYQNIIKSLGKYNITEDMAVKYSEMTDYSQYSQILQKYGGNENSDSNN